MAARLRGPESRSRSRGASLRCPVRRPDRKRFRVEQERSQIDVAGDSERGSTLFYGAMPHIWPIPYPSCQLCKLLDIAIRVTHDAIVVIATRSIRYDFIFICNAFRSSQLVTPVRWWASLVRPCFVPRTLSAQRHRGSDNQRHSCLLAASLVASESENFQSSTLHSDGSLHLPPLSEGGARRSASRGLLRPRLWERREAATDEWSGNPQNTACKSGTRCLHEVSSNDNLCFGIQWQL